MNGRYMNRKYGFVLDDFYPFDVTYKDFKPPWVAHLKILIAVHLGFLDALRTLAVHGHLSEHLHGTQMGRSLLFYAMTRATGQNSNESLRVLLELGANANESDEKGCPALHHAVRQTHPDCEKVVQLLLTHGANPNAADDVNGQRPLHCLAEVKTPGVPADSLKLLIKHGADGTLPDHSGSIPLHVMVKYIGGKYEDNKTFSCGNLHLLLQTGIDPDLRGNNSATALEIVDQRFQYYLHNRIKTADDWPSQAVCYLTAAKLLVDHGAKLSENLKQRWAVERRGTATSLFNVLTYSISAPGVWWGYGDFYQPAILFEGSKACMRLREDTPRDAADVVMEG